MDASAGGPRTRLGQVSHSVVLGTFNVGEQGESVVPDLSRVIGAVLNSFGIGNQTSVDGSGGVQPTMQFNAPAQAPQGSESERRRGTAGDESQAGSQSLNGNQHMPQVMQIPIGAAIPLPSLNVVTRHDIKYKKSMETMAEVYPHLILNNFSTKPGTFLDQKEKLIKYSDFVNKELILFSMADLQRSINSIDG